MITLFCEDFISNQITKQKSVCLILLCIPIYPSVRCQHLFRQPKKNNSKSNLFKDEFHSYNPNPAIPTFNITTKKTINKLISSHRSTAAHALQSQTNPSGFSFLYFLWDNIAVFSFFHLWINRIPNTTWKKMAKDIMMTSGQKYLSLELFSRTDRSWDTFAAKRDASHKCRTKFCLSVKWLVCTCPFDS